MIESEDYQDPTWKIPVFSLYGAVRRPTEAMLETCDVVLVDLQDIGTRIYTFVTTLGYVLEAGARAAKASGCWTAPTPPAGPLRERSWKRAGKASSASVH